MAGEVISLADRRRRAAVLGWLPVAGLIVALFVAPSSTGAAGSASLTVTPGSGSYGGQSVKWTGNVGVSGVQRIHLQRRGSTSAAWADVPHSNVGETAANGSFNFFFPAPAMNSVYFRVVSRHGATPAHSFDSVHQDAEITIDEADPADVALPRDIAVAGETYSLAVDTVHGAAGETKPILTGRTVHLQRRVTDGTWEPIATGSIKSDGLLSFGPYGPGDALQVPGSYRVRLEYWDKNGDRVGWFLSLPYDVRLVRRPEPVDNLTAIPHTTSIDLEWTLPTDSERDAIEIYRTMGATAPNPTAKKPYQRIARLGGAATTYTDSGLDPNSTYKYAVYTVSADLVYTRVPARYTVVTPQQRGVG